MANGAASGLAPSCAITGVDSIELAVGADPWAYAEANRAAIGAEFAARRRDKPALFNGPIHLACDHVIAEGTLRGTLVRTDYASFLFWRERWRDDPSVRNVFAAGCVHCADGALILGEMAAHTANAGLIYPPSGSPEDDDMIAGRFDVAANVLRELHEETGLSPDIGAGGWLVIDDAPRLAMLKRIDLTLSAEDAVAAIQRHRAAEREPELCGIHVVRARGDIVPERMQPYTLAYIHHAFAT